MRFLNCLLIGFMLLCLHSCIKDEMECSAESEIPGELDELGLPPATTTGENTFGCLVNGEPWLPLKRNVFGNLYYVVNFSYGTISPGTFTCQSIQDYDSLSSMFQFNVFDAFETDSYSSSSMGAERVFEDYAKGLFYDIDLNYPNTQVVITRLDEEESIISGTFELRYLQTNVDDDEVQDTLLVTNGRFDLKGS